MSNNIKVLFVSGNLGPGGKERQFVEVISYLDLSKISPIVLVFKKNQFYTKNIIKLGLPFYQISRGHIKISPFFKIWKIFRNHRPDIVHAWDTLSMLYTYLPAKYFGCKIIDGSIRDSGVDIGWELFYKKFFLKKADLILSNSNSGLKAHNVKGFVVYNIIKINRFLIPQVNNQYNIISVANFNNHKDYDTFIKASLELIKEKSVDLVYLVGDGPNRKKYEDFIAECYPNFKSKFIFTGVITNVEEILAKCQIGILCSTIKYKEGISNAVLEYMAAGLVAIVTDIGGSSEIIDDGINGFLIRPSDYKRIVELVQTVKCNKQLQLNLITNARRTVEEKFSVSVNLSKLLEIYKSLL